MPRRAAPRGRAVALTVRSGAIAAVVAALTPTAATGQILRLSPLTGEIGLRGTSAQSADVRRLSGAEWMRLDLRGALLDPGLLRFGLGLRPGLEQSRLAGATEGGGLNARLVGVDAHALALPGRPLWGVARYLRLSRDESAFGAYGTGRLGLNTALSGELHFTNPLMPLQLEYRRESWIERLPQTAESEAPRYSWGTLRFSGWSSKTGINLERRSSDAPQRYVNRLGTFENTQRWGKGSRLQLRVNAQDQSGEQIIRSSAVDGYLSVHLQHTTTIGSDWNASLGRGTAAGVATGRRSGEGALSWQAATWLSTGVRGLATRVRAPGLDQREFRAGPRATVALRLPFRAGLTLAGEYAYDRLALAGGDDPWVVVVGEPHAFDQSGTFRLDNLDADPATIVIRGPGGVFQQGLDYTLVLTGGLVEVVLLPGGRLTPDAAVLVDYRYRGRASDEATSHWLSYSGDFQIRGLRVYHRRWVRDPSGPDDPGPFAAVRHLEQDVSGAQLSLSRRAARGTVVAERRLWVDGSRELSSTVLAASVAVRPAPRFGTGLRGRYTTGASAAARTQLVAATLTLDWTAHRTLQLGTELSAWRLTQNQTERNTELGLNARLTWEPGLLRAVVHYYRRDWARSLVGTPDSPIAPLHQLMVEVTRRF